MLSFIFVNALIVINAFTPVPQVCGTFTHLHYDNYQESLENAQTVTATDVVIDASRGLGIYIPKFIWPVSNGRMGEGFGVPRPETNSVHMGVDLFPGEGTPILAATDGVVVKVEEGTGSYGYMVEIYDGYEYSTLYAHMIAGSFADYGISVGTAVKQGQVIGLVGNTGRSTGAHLHFEIKDFDTKVDPMPVMQKYAIG